tara:strand:+ start:558 stop:1505 length:948 start_codon:yes stop_codon:yes gene_type:complete
LNLNSKIYVAGHKGMVGSALKRKLEEKGYKSIIGETSANLDLRNQKDVANFFEKENPEYVIIAAAKVGGINANNKYRADFINDNLQIQTNLINQSFKSEVKKLLFLGSSCIYPKECKQPIKEEFLMSGFLEPTNEPYAIAKIAGIKMCESYAKQYSCNFISAMPTNLYGPNDNFNLETSHVLPALINKIYSAKKLKNSSVMIWGTGKPLREFLHVDDLADACIFLMENVNSDDIYNQNISQINIGSGSEISIDELAHKIIDVIRYNGDIKFDTSKPNGTMRKFLDSSRINALGWKPSINLDDGLKKTYEWFLDNQ